MSIHHYSDDTMSSVQDFINKIEDQTTTMRKYSSKPIILSEFGYNTPTAISRLPEEISYIKGLIATDSRLISGAYWQLLERDWMQYFTTWDSYAQTTIFDKNFQPKEPYYSQFLGPAK